MSEFSIQLVTLLRSLKQNATNNTFTNFDWVSVKSAKEQQGLAIVQNAFTEEALLGARAAALAAWEQDVKPQIPAGDYPPQGATLFEITRNKKLWPTTTIGNQGFGYLIAGGEAKDERHVVTLSSGKKIVFAMGSAYQANLALLCHPTSADALQLLFEVSGYPDKSIISHDYCKIHRGDLTPAHVDIYQRNEETTHRMQAIAFGLGEGRVRLCYFRFSHRPEVKLLICQMIGKVIYGERGYQALPPEKVATILDCFIEADCVQFGSPRDLIMWEPGVIHLEMQLAADGKLRRANDTRTTTERYVVGTHVPVGFSPRDLLEIGCIADRGFVFHPYDNANAGNAADRNSMHKKRTQWKARRPVTEVEKKRATALNSLDFDAISATWSAAKRRCYVGEGAKRKQSDEGTEEDAGAKAIKINE
jgi:hypothetical protein